MNERIKELMNQAAKQYYADTGEIKPNDMMYIFAELIVRECMLICGAVQGAGEVHNMPEFASGAAQCKRTIKEHFGVE